MSIFGGKIAADTAFSAGTKILGGITNAIFAQNQAKQQYKYQRKLMEYQNELSNKNYDKQRVDALYDAKHAASYDVQSRQNAGRNLALGDGQINAAQASGAASIAAPSGGTAALAHPVDFSPEVANTALTMAMIGKTQAETNKSNAETELTQTQRQQMVERWSIQRERLGRDMDEAFEAVKQGISESQARVRGIDTKAAESQMNVAWLRKQMEVADKQMETMDLNNWLNTLKTQADVDMAYQKIKESQATVKEIISRVSLNNATTKKVLEEVNNLIKTGKILDIQYTELSADAKKAMSERDFSMLKTAQTWYNTIRWNTYANPNYGSFLGSRTHSEGSSSGVNVNGSVGVGAGGSAGVGGSVGAGLGYNESHNVSDTDGGIGVLYIVNGAALDALDANGLPKDPIELLQRMDDAYNTEIRSYGNNNVSNTFKKVPSKPKAKAKGKRK